MALTVLDGRGGRAAYPPEVVRWLERGNSGESSETRNQEFALVLISCLPPPGAENGETSVAAASGTDGVDGPTNAAGTIVDSPTLRPASMFRLDAAQSLHNNDSYQFFSALDDLVRTGPTGTNVGMSKLR